MGNCNTNKAKLTENAFAQAVKVDYSEVFCISALFGHAIINWIDILNTRQLNLKKNEPAFS